MFAQTALFRVITWLSAADPSHPALPALAEFYLGHRAVASRLRYKNISRFVLPCTPFSCTVARLWLEDKYPHFLYAIKIAYILLAPSISMFINPDALKKLDRIRI